MAASTNATITTDMATTKISAQNPVKTTLLTSSSQSRGEIRRIRRLYDQEREQFHRQRLEMTEQIAALHSDSGMHYLRTERSRAAAQRQMVGELSELRAQLQRQQNERQQERLKYEHSVRLLQDTIRISKTRNAALISEISNLQNGKLDSNQQIDQMVKSSYPEMKQQPHSNHKRTDSKSDSKSDSKIDSQIDSKNGLNDIRYESALKMENEILSLKAERAQLRRERDSLQRTVSDIKSKNTMLLMEWNKLNEITGGYRQKFLQSDAENKRLSHRLTMVSDQQRQTSRHKMKVSNVHQAAQHMELESMQSIRTLKRAHDALQRDNQELQRNLEMKQQQIINMKHDLMNAQRIIELPLPPKQTDLADAPGLESSPRLGEQVQVKNVGCHEKMHCAFKSETNANWKAQTLKSAKQTIKEYEELHRDHRLEWMAMDNKWKKAQQQIKDQQRRISEVNKHNESLQENMRIQQEMHRKELEKVHAAAEQVGMESIKSIRTLKHKQEALRKDNKQMEQQLKDHHQEWNAVHTKIRGFDQATARNHATIKSLETKIESHREINQMLQNTNNALKRQINENDQRNNNQITTLQNGINTARRDMLDKEQAIDTLKDQVANESDAYAHATTKVRDIEKTLQSLRMETTEKSLQISVLNKNNEFLQRGRNEAETALHSLRLKVQSMKQLQDTTKDTMNELKKNLNQKKEECERLEGFISDLRRGRDRQCNQQKLITEAMQSLMTDVGSLVQDAECKHINKWDN